MAASQSEESDVLWGISPDPFPFQTPLKEMQVTSSRSYMLQLNLFNLTKAVFKLQGAQRFLTMKS